MEDGIIVLADSDKVFRKTLSEFLKGKGFTSIINVDPFREDEFFEQVTFDILIVEFWDIMHGRSCDETVTGGRKFSNAIFTCRCHSKTTEALARMLNPAIYLIKPVEPMDVYEVLIRLLKYQKRSVGEGPLERRLYSGVCHG